MTMRPNVLALLILLFAGTLILSTSGAFANHSEGYGEEEMEEMQKELEEKRTLTLLDRGTITGGARRQVGLGAGLFLGGDAELAGDLLANAQFDLDYSYADVDDRTLGGDGSDKGLSLTMSGEFTKFLNFAIAAGYDRYKIDTPSTEIESVYLEGVLLYKVSDKISVGPILGFTRSDVDQPGSTGDSDPDRWSSGVIAAMSENIGSYDVGVTSAVVSTNKSSLGEILDDEDSIWSTMLSANTEIADGLSADLSTTYMTYLDNRGPVDSSFWLLGIDFNYTLSDTVDISFGYETTAAYKDYEENRFNLGLSYRW